MQTLPPCQPASPPAHSVEDRSAPVQARPPRSSHHARDRANPAPRPPPACLSVRFRASPEVDEPSLLPLRSRGQVFAPWPFCFFSQHVTIKSGQNLPSYRRLHLPVRCRTFANSWSGSIRIYTEEFFS